MDCFSTLRWNRYFDHFLSKMAYFQYFAKSSKIDSSKNNQSIWTQKVSKDAWSYDSIWFMRVRIKWHFISLCAFSALFVDLSICCIQFSRGVAVKYKPKSLFQYIWMVNPYLLNIDAFFWPWVLRQLERKKMLEQL